GSWRFAITYRENRFQAIGNVHRPHPEELRTGLLERPKEAVPHLLAACDRQPLTLRHQGRQHVAIQLNTSTGQVALSVRSKVTPAPPRSICIAQRNSNAVTARDALYPAQDSFQHLLELGRSEQ